MEKVESREVGGRESGPNERIAFVLSTGNPLNPQS